MYHYFDDIRPYEAPEDETGKSTGDCGPFMIKSIPERQKMIGWVVAIQPVKLYTQARWCEFSGSTPRQLIFICPISSVGIEQPPSKR